MTFSCCIKLEELMNFLRPTIQGSIECKKLVKVHELKSWCKATFPTQQRIMVVYDKLRYENLISSRSTTHKAKKDIGTTAVLFNIECDATLTVFASYSFNFICYLVIQLLCHFGYKKRIFSNIITQQKTCSYLCIRHA